MKVEGVVELQRRDGKGPYWTVQTPEGTMSCYDARIKQYAGQDAPIEVKNTQAGGKYLTFTDKGKSGFSGGGEKKGGGWVKPDPNTFYMSYAKDILGFNIAKSETLMSINEQKACITIFYNLFRDLNTTASKDEEK